jgi:hypothetical protein
LAEVSCRTPPVTLEELISKLRSAALAAVMAGSVIVNHHLMIRPGKPGTISVTRSPFAILESL